MTQNVYSRSRSAILASRRQFAGKKWKVQSCTKHFTIYYAGFILSRHQYFLKWTILIVWWTMMQRWWVLLIHFPPQTLSEGRWDGYLLVPKEYIAVSSKAVYVWNSIRVHNVFTFAFPNSTITLSPEAAKAMEAICGYYREVENVARKEPSYTYQEVVMQATKTNHFSAHRSYYCFQNLKAWTML